MKPRHLFPRPGLARPRPARPVRPASPDSLSGLSGLARIRAGAGTTGLRPEAPDEADADDGTPEADHPATINVSRRDIRYR